MTKQATKQAAHLWIDGSRWDWPKYQASLVGPLPHILRPSGCYVPDYSHPGVADRVRVEVDYIEDMERRT